jgi:subtilisin family serine protease
MRARSALPLALAGLLLAGTSALAAPKAPAQLDRGLQWVESGQPVPIANRPVLSRVRLQDRLNGETSSWRKDYTPPSEFGVTFQYDGPRVELEAAGIRVQSQIGNKFTARVRPNEIGALRGMAGIRNAQLARYCQPDLNVSAVDVTADLEHAASGSPPVYGGRAGQGIILGDVDSGIDFTRSDFMDGSGQTRILYIWDQNDAVGPNPPEFGYGTEWTKSDIDNTPGSVRQLDADGHGTNVAGVLVGNGSMTGCSQPAYRYVGMAPLAEFIEVNTDFSNAGIIDGVDYIFQKAAALGKDAVVNLSLGSQFGPHDGSDDFATSLSALTGPGKILVCSAGNNNSSNMHGKLTTTSTTVGTDYFSIVVPSYTNYPGTFNDYFLITGWTDATTSLTIRIKGPRADDTLSVGFGNCRDKALTVVSTKGGKLFVLNNNTAFGYDGTATSHQFEIEVYDSLANSCPRNGVWQIQTVPNGAANIGKRVDIWVYQSDLGASSLKATVGVNQDNSTLVGSPAAADSAFAVAAHTTKTSWYSCASAGTCSYTSGGTFGDIATFSSPGPRRDGVLKPEISAPGFGVATTHSNQAGAIGSCGDVDDGVHEMNAGTSFSSPHVAGAAALFLQYQPGSSPSKVKQWFEAHARTDSWTGSVPNTVWGYGKLDIYATIDHVAPVVALTSPNGGESWNVGDVHNITWTATDNVGVTSVDLDYSLHGAGGPWLVVAHGLANSGSYPWTVPVPVTDSAVVRVGGVDAGGNSASAASASLFQILNGAGVPTGGKAIFALSRPKPNPGQGPFQLAFSLPATGNASIEIIGVNGGRVWQRSESGMQAGPHTFVWDGRDASGRRAPAGLYFVRLTSTFGSRTARLVQIH